VHGVEPLVAMIVMTTRPLFNAIDVLRCLSQLFIIMF